MLGFYPMGSQAIGAQGESASVATFYVTAAGRATGMSNVFGSGTVIFFTGQSLSVNDKITLELLPSFDAAWVDSSFTIELR
jgi:hypothetical protein